MKSRKLLGIIHNISGFLGIICLFVSAGLMVAFVSGRVAEKRAETKTEYSDVSHRILFLRSYHPLYFTHDDQDRGLEKSLIPNGIEYDVYYMEAKSFGSKNDVEVFHQFLKSRLQKYNNYEAVLISDDEALRFVLDYQDELFKGLPVVFFGINNLDLAEAAVKNPYITGFFENQYIGATVELAVKLFPERKILAALHDDSAAGKADMKAFMEFFARHEDYSILDINVSDYSQEEFIEILETLPESSLLFYMTCYTDKYGNIYSMKSRTEMVVNHAKVPIFRNYVGGEAKGVLGTIHLDFEKQAYLAGLLLNEIFAGKDVSTIPLYYETPGVCVVDWQLMKNYNLDFSLLPKDTVLVNQPNPFFRQYRLLIYSVFLIMAGLAFLTVLSYCSSLKAKEITRELRVSRDDLIRSQEEIRYQAEFDEILDILNRRTITERLIDKSGECQLYSCVILDIDGFKAINENYGHTFADSILQYVVALLKEIARDTDWLIGRYGGDEFLLYVPNIKLYANHPVVEKILDGIRTPIPLGDETLAITASIGIAVAEGDNQASIEQNITYAEAAMYEAKNSGRNGVSVFDEALRSKFEEEIEIKEKLEKAFVNDGFYMVYQPQVNSQTKKISGFEALIRMKEPGMYPGKFIPVAERNGWIWKIGRITTELVVKQIAQWRDAGYEIRPVSVNFSSNQLNDHGYIGFLEGLLKKYNVSPEYIEIEITEGVFLEKSALAQSIFDHFKEIGIKLLMDDFGTGYSSLGYLTYIPVDVIKLDKSLVDTYLVDGKDSFIKNIIHLMHDLNKEMIIEGVEEEWQFKRLQEFGADTIQGYYFSKPLEADQAIVFEVK